MNFLALIIKKFLPKTNFFGIPEKILMPALIYLAAKKGMLKVKGLDFVALTQIANSIVEYVGFKHMGFGSLHSSQPPRTPGETYQQLKARYGNVSLPQAQYNRNYQGVKTFGSLLSRGYE